MNAASVSRQEKAYQGVVSELRRECRIIDDGEHECIDDSRRAFEGFA